MLPASRSCLCPLMTGYTFQLLPLVGGAASPIPSFTEETHAPHPAPRGALPLAMTPFGVVAATIVFASITSHLSQLPEERLRWVYGARMATGKVRSVAARAV